MFSIILMVIQVASCAYVTYVSAMVLNRMSHQTRTLIRLAYLLVLSGAACGVLYCFEATAQQALMALGVSVFLAANQRTGHARKEATQ